VQARTILPWQAWFMLVQAAKNHQPTTGAALENILEIAIDTIEPARSIHED